MTATAAPFVSVVTPFYNTAAYLRECIESVLAQTHERFEYILVDNLSTDGGAEIAREFARADRRVRLVIPPRHLTQVENYNFALSLIGPSVYCKIVQADDFIFPDCLQQMVAVAEQQPSVAIVSAYSQAAEKIKGLGLPPDRSVFSGKEVCRTQLTTPMFFFGSPTCVMYRSDLVRRRSPFFQSDRLHEDTELCYDVLREADFGFVHKVLAFQRTGNGVSSVQQSIDPHHVLDRYIVIKRFGGDYLSAAEHRAALQNCREKHARLLAEGVVALQPTPFWRYHATGLASVGERIDWPAVMRYLPRAVYEQISDPAALGRKVRRAVARNGRWGQRGADADSR